MTTPSTKARPKPAGRKTPGRSPDRRMPVLTIVLVVVGVLGVVAILLARGGTEDADAAAEVAEVEVDGAALPAFDGEAAADPAIGQPAPGLRGSDLDGDVFHYTPGGERPALVAFFAHWCPACQQEVPELAPWLADGGAADIDVVTVSTSVDRSAPNYPPSEWLEREGWPLPVLADSADGDAAQAYGLTAYPYFVAVSAEGEVVARTSGMLGPEQVEALLAVAREAS